ncbi:MAG: hypothetical protein VKS61_14095 [Candidatus Sericytochromatia bacterium]|nr:hypothetical protein [Candidatus Sericytochromatia bacterium]
MDRTSRDMTPEEAHELLTAYVHAQLGPQASVGAPMWREDHEVWEAWVGGLPQHVKAFIVRLGTDHGAPVCRHITVMDRDPRGLDLD